ncbi:hypothetical protein ABPG72_018015 [Tetrahymena utriculariae]
MDPKETTFKIKQMLFLFQQKLIMLLKVIPTPLYCKKSQYLSDFSLIYTILLQNLETKIYPIKFIIKTIKIIPSKQQLQIFSSIENNFKISIIIYGRMLPIEQNNDWQMNFLYRLDVESNITQFPQTQLHSKENQKKQFDKI